jgi:hypothetical protein
LYGVFIYPGYWEETAIAANPTDDSFFTRGASFGISQQTPQSFIRQAGLSKPSAQGDPDKICDSKIYWTEMEREMSHIAKSVGGRYDKETSLITGLDKVKFGYVAHRFRSAGLEVFTNYNPDHPGLNLRVQVAGERWYHVTIVWL